MDTTELPLLKLSDHAVSLLNTPKTLGIVQYCAELEKTHQEILSLLPRMPKTSEYSQFILNLSSLLGEEIVTLRRRIDEINARIKDIQSLSDKSCSTERLSLPLPPTQTISPPTSPMAVKSKLTKKLKQTQTPKLHLSQVVRTSSKAETPKASPVDEKDMLTLELLQMTHRLKSQNLNLQNLVLQDRKGLDAVHRKIGTTSRSFKKEQKNLSDYSSKSVFTTWRLFLIVIGCLLLFILCFLIILIA